jgi:hypothetical protein
MEEYKNLLAIEIRKAKKLVPKGNGKLDGLINQLKSFNDVISDLDKKLVEISKKYYSENSLDNIELEEMNQIRKKALIDFSNSLGIPGINAR